MKKLFFLFLSMFHILGCGVEVDPRTIWANQLGTREFKKGSVTDSQGHILEALKIDPFIGELHLNLGLTYEGLQQPDSAVQAYQSAEKWGQNREVLFNSRFNQGVVHGLNKKVDLAIDRYQSSLEMKPESIEAKTNIELLLQGQAGGGEGDGKNQDKDKKDGKSGQDEKKDDKGEGEKDQEKDPTQPKQVEKNKEYKPREFKGDLSEQDVKKILGELKQQEQKIRGQFYRGNGKEKPRDKDW